MFKHKFERAFTANVLRLSQSLYFLNSKKLVTELELAKMKMLKLEIKVDTKIDRVCSPGLYTY